MRKPHKIRIFHHFSHTMYQRNITSFYIYYQPYIKSIVNATVLIHDNKHNLFKPYRHKRLRKW